MSRRTSATVARRDAVWRAAIEKMIEARDEFKGCDWPDGKIYERCIVPCGCTGCAPLRALLAAPVGLCGATTLISGKPCRLPGRYDGRCWNHRASEGNAP